MKHLAPLMATAVLLISSAASSVSPTRRAEVTALIGRFASGTATAHEVATRLAVLQEDAWASHELCEAIAREADAGRRAEWMALLAGVAVRGADVEGVLERGLADSELGMRMAALRGLARAGIVRVVPQIEAALGDARSGVRREAARALGRLGATRSAAALEKSVASETDLEARVLALEALGLVGTRRSWPVVEKFLENPSESTRHAAARALLRQGAPTGQAFARRQLSSKVDLDRMAAVRLYEGVTLAVAARDLSAALSDASAGVRATAARVLAQAGDATKVPWLVVQARDAPAADRAAFEEALEALHLSDEQRAAALRRAGR